MIDWTLLAIICVIFIIPFTWGILRISRSNASSSTKRDIETLGQAVLDLYDKVETLLKEVERIEGGRRGRG